MRAAPPGTRVPARVREVVLRGLRARADNRYASMNNLLEDLERAGGERRRSSWAWVAVAAMVLLAAGATVLAVKARASAPRSAPEALSSGSAVPSAVSSPAPRCASNAACMQESGGRPARCRKDDGACVLLESEDCVLRAEPGDVENDDTVFMGTMFPETGPGWNRSGDWTRRAPRISRAATLPRCSTARRCRVRGPRGQSPSWPATTPRIGRGAQGASRRSWACLRSSASAAREWSWTTRPASSFHGRRCSCRP